MEKEIIELLGNREAKTFLEISEILKLGKEQDELLAKTLNDMTDNYDLYCTKKGKYMLFTDSEMSKDFIKGKYLDTNNDYGFVEIDNSNSDIFIHGSNTGGALNGDIVLVNITKGEKRDKKCEGKIVKVLKHELKNKVGEIYQDNGKLMVDLDDRKVNKKIILLGNDDELNRLVEGDKVLVSFTSSKNSDSYIYADFIKRIGNINDPDIDILSIIADCGFNIDFPDSVHEELKRIPTEVKETEYKDRRDLRNEMIFTIDGDDTKDIDDAISCKILKNANYELGVHIADVSYYVKENSPLDIEARDRGTSVYLTDRVIPMLPHQLSNGICSLNPQVDRLAISCVMEFNHEGKMVNYDIFPSVIKSNIQMTYKHVNEYLERGIVPEGYENFTEMLSNMLELSIILRDNKVRRGAIDFDTDEAKIIVDKSGKPIDIIKRDRGTGEKLIEDFMIAANECVANHIFHMDLPSLYRVHGFPSEERLLKFLNILSILGVTFKADVKKIKPKTIQYIVNELKRYPEFKVLSTMMLSCMDKAIYDINNIGHFGIASRCYTHFTSPIRRYPDTTIHRLLHNYFFMEDGITDEKVRHFKEILPEIGLHSSEKERASIECEREVESMKMAEYMESHIGEEYEGMISSVTSFGFFVQLDNLIEGLVQVLSLNEFYQYDQKTESLIATKSHKRFMIGDIVIVKVESASKEERQIDFKFIKRVDVNEKDN